MALLFEHGEQAQVSDPQTLKRFLSDVWISRASQSRDQQDDMDDEETGRQPFLTFDGNWVRARNYIGFIQDGTQTIEIFPKVFKQVSPSDDNKLLMLRHIFYWLGYCRKWRFPFSPTGLELSEIDSLPELIINLIANQFLDTVSNQPLSLYQLVEEPLQRPRGSINFKRYVANGLSRGNLHVLECDHEPFVFDNRVNRIIKYCCRLLLNRTTLTENVHLLQETLFVLDEVQDEVATVHDLERITLNSFFDEYLSVMNSCRMILGQQIYSHRPYDLSQWCLLLPMEYIFEDFVAGFLYKKFNREWRVEYQKSNMYLVDHPSAIFQMQHDIFLTSRTKPSRKLIIDTKYKLRPAAFKNDKKKGVSQTDLYQMTSYGFRRGVNDLIVLYPNTSETLNEADTFQIRSGFQGQDILNVTAIDIPFWSIIEFDSLAERLESRLNEILF